MTATFDADGHRDRASTSAATIRHGIVYATPDGKPLRGDFYAPAGPGPFPVVVALPGGGWLVSDPGGLRHWGDFLARNGLATFAIQYRVSATDKTFPDPVCDALGAIQFVRGSATELGVDPQRIGLLGASAGAHAAALAALAGDAPQFTNRTPANAHAGVDARVKLLAGVYGVYDMLAHWQHEIADFPLTSGRRSECFMGGPPFADRQLYFDASPISHVRHVTNKLPVFVGYGTADAVVDPRSQSEQFLRTLRQAGHVVRECPVNGAGHFWFSEEHPEEPRSFAGFLAPHLLRFLKRHL
ncbi:alpha/beta hydrolase family protein [Variovorax fucosicus]|uniref:alpha/beta hydrolase family protein n=1 Tax=Variovorax fucosicus TaxID=3053517 RepID=UPI0025788051|nr:alpha/beta hydrolase [Variovorax sp. J22G47]MDM0059126.1 alpha/beta hydrolase [Variovorax sp. J22G47]